MPSPALRALFLLLPGGLAAQGGDEALLGPGFEVLGERVTPAELKRAIVVGVRGREELASRKLLVFIDEELERSGRRVVQGDAQAPWDIRRSGRRVAQSDVQDAAAHIPFFDEVFLPLDPREYPLATREALNASSPDFVQRLIDGHIARLAAEEQARARGEPPKPVDPEGEAMFRDLMRRIVVDALERSAEVKTFLDGLPPETALVVNGREIATEDVWRAIRSRVRAEDADEARAWFERTIAVRKALEAQGAYLTAEQFAEVYQAHAGPFAASPFNMEAVAVNFKKFPSPEHYKAFFRLQESYRRLIAEDLTTGNLQAHLEEGAGDLLGLAQLNADVILIPAYDFELDAYKQNGWEEAAQLAVQCVRELAEGAAWEATLERYSQWYEPPADPSMPAAAAAFRKNKGRFGPRKRNELLRDLGESDWSQFLTGNTVTDYVFFELEVGQPSQPLRGPHGYYIAKVKGRTPPSAPVSIDPTGQRALVEQDYVNVRFNTFCQEQVDRLHAGK